MTSPTLQALQQLHRLDRSLPTFHDQLSNLLYGKEYQECVQKVQGDDLVWLIDYLDKVRRSQYFSILRLSYCRLSMVSILPAQLPGNVYANSEPCVAPRG